MTKESKRGKFPERWVDEEGYERDQEGNLINDDAICDAIRDAQETLECGDRGAALRYWQRIADGERDDVGIDEFIRLVASRLVDADRNKGTARRDEIVKAVGRTGQGPVDPVLNARERKNTKARDDRIADLILLKLPEREVWKKLAEEGLFRPAPAEGRKEAIPSQLRGAIRKVRKAQDARHRELVRG